MKINKLMKCTSRLRIMETERRLVEAGVVLDPTNGGSVPGQDPGLGSKKQTTRRHRRKLPEIPKHKKRRILQSLMDFRYKEFCFSFRRCCTCFYLWGTKRRHAELGGTTVTRPESGLSSVDGTWSGQPRVDLTWPRYTCTERSGYLGGPIQCSQSSLNDPEPGKL